MKRFGFLLVALLAAAMSVSQAMAATVVVTPANPQGWHTGDMRGDGTVTYEPDATTPAGDDALQLTTGSAASKAQYVHETNTALSSITELSYYTRQVAGPPHAAVSYQLATCLNGVTSENECLGFTTLVYEPYQNGTVLPEVWQQWDVDAGQFWSSRSYSSGACTVVAGGGGAPFYTLAGLKATCPNAVVFQYIANVGSNNPGYVVRTDLFNFNGTVSDFELANDAKSTDDCKDGGFLTHTRADGSEFKNQGDCIQYVITGE